MESTGKGSLKVLLFFSIVFFLILTPYLTSNSIEPLMSESINKDYSKSWGGYKWDGFGSLAVLYFTLALSCWITPPIIAITGAVTAITIGGIGSSLALGMFIFPFKYGLKVAAVFSGLSTSILVTGQGSYLGKITTKETNTRDTGTFYSIVQLGPILGGSLVSLLFQGKDHIPEETRDFLYPCLIGVGFLGIVGTFFLRSSKSTDKPPSPLSVIKKSFRLLATKRMGLLAVTCFHIGLGSSFMSNLYGTSVGYTRSFGVDRKGYAGESGMFIGAGEIIAGIMFIVTRKKKKTENLLIVGYLLALVNLGGIYLNLPDSASRIDTAEPAIIHSSVPLAFLCAFCLGFVDGCFQTQMNRIIVRTYPEDSAAPFAIFISVMSIAMALMNLFSTSFGLHFHCVLLAFSSTVGAIAFFASLRVKDGRGVDDDADSFDENTPNPIKKQSTISIGMSEVQVTVNEPQSNAVYPSLSQDDNRVQISS